MDFAFTLKVPGDMHSRHRLSFICLSAGARQQWVSPTPLAGAALSPGTMTAFFSEPESAPLEVLPGSGPHSFPSSLTLGDHPPAPNRAF